MLGVTAFEQSDFQTAITYFTDALEQNPQDTDLLNNRAICYRELEKYDIALQDVSSAIIISPMQALYYSTRASILTKMKKQLEALDDINTAINLHPIPEYLENKIIILKKMNRFQEALSIIENIESQGYGTPEISIFKGTILIDVRKLKEAIQVFESLLDTTQRQLAIKYLTILKQSGPKLIHDFLPVLTRSLE